uniref:ubl carboxyl-terminal hydrolase 18-like n=1 Tax=Monopterus albus TaxID=43700 RepID=UPI0009B3B417|nr:ubl carboxyl-terminal hydrolase 18-like [Monopterus albus]
MRGLINYGTYCSINSVVQCLYETRELRDLIRRVDERDYQAPNHKNTVAPTLKSLIREMSTDGPSPCDPSCLVDSMSAYSGVRFDVQEDSELIFKCIVNALADGCGAAKEIGKLWDIEKEDSVRCLGCNAVRSIRTKSNTIPVSIEENLPDELQEYIKRHSDTTTTCDCHCANCHTRTRVEIASKVVSLPPVVCMRIARVKNIGRGAAHIVKTEKRFAFTETVDLKYLVKEPADTPTLYELYAVVAHRGTHYCGHYTAYVRAEDSWYIADDTYIRMCSWGDVKTTYEAGSNLYDGVAYMLMYRRRNSSR